MDLEVVNRLGKLKLSATEEGGVDLDLLDIEGNADLCEKSLMGKIMGEKLYRAKANNEQVMV